MRVEQAVRLRLSGESKLITRKKIHEFRNSGQEARVWRKRISLLAKRGKETVRTLQFPLDLPLEVASSIPLDQYKVAYNAIEGTGVGTLFDYWAKLHLAGFRFFSSSGQASIFRQEKLFRDVEWNAAFVNQTGYEWPWFLPTKLYERFTKAPREITKKDGTVKSVQFTPENVANECHVALAGVSISNKTPEAQKQFFLRLGGTLADQFDTWKSANADTVIVLGVVDKFLKSEGLNLPSLAHIAAQCGATLPEYATVAFYDSPITLCSNVGPAVFARCASRYPNEPDGSIAKFVQEHATTPNVTALAWLFGNGLLYFRETELSVIMSEMNIPNSARNAIQDVQNAARALPNIQIFGKKNYSSFRPNFGGKIDSWISNYGSRLILLHGLLKEIEPDFQLPPALYQNETLMSGIDVNESELKDLIAAVYANAEGAVQAILVLLGQTVGEIDFSITAFEKFSTLLDSLCGTLNTIAARYERAIDMAGSDEARLEKLLECKFVIPKWCKPVPKLVGISGGLPDVEKEVSALNNEFQTVLAKMRARYTQILTYITAQGHTTDVYATLEARELEQLRKLNTPRPERAHIQARRAVLHRIGRAVQNCSESTKQRFVSLIKDTGVFANIAHLNTFIFNQKGAIYRSPFDRARNGQYRMDGVILLQINWLRLVEQLVAEIIGSDNQQDKEDALRLERTLLQLNLSGIPEKVQYPSSLARPDIDVGIPIAMQMQLSKESVSSDVLQRGFNLYSSALSGLTFKILRKGFTFKMRFGIGDDTQLIYTPKQKVWNVPKQYLNAETGIGIAARLISTNTPVEMLAQVAQGAPEVLGEFMRQSPHDWYYDAKIDSDVIEGRVVKKGEVLKHGKQKGYRLVGAPSFKSVLDKALVGLTDIGRACVVIEVPYTQNVDADFNVTIQPQPPKLTLSLPVTERITVTEKDETMLFDRFIAIDLGERGLGFAVFDAKTLKLIESGHLLIKDISNLMRRTQHYEMRPNERQKFQAKFNVNLSELRENTVGAVCHQINRLCAYYSAFPVMEYMSGDRLNKQIKSVYEQVTNRYIWSSTDAHKTARVQFWLGGENWEHSYLKVRKDKKQVPLVLSPGKGVPSKGTSQRCSCCGRNPFDLLSDMKDKDKIAVLNGKAIIGAIELKLFEQTRENKDDAQKRRQQNQRRSMKEPLSPGNYTVAELRTVIRSNLRQAPGDRRSPDTTMSRYQCVFSDCGRAMHADENASVNIGIKLIEELVSGEMPSNA